MKIHFQLSLQTIVLLWNSDSLISDDLFIVILYHLYQLLACAYQLWRQIEDAFKSKFIVN